MTYYNRDFQKLKLKQRKLKFLNCGKNAQVFYTSDIVLKEYFSETDLRCRLSPEMFDILKKIDNPHFIKLFDIYSDFELLDLLKNGNPRFIVDAYTAKYYSDASVDVLYIPKDYILDNFRELEILFEIFTNNSICVDDIKRKNAVLSNENIIIIDPDAFYTTTSSKNNIAVENKKKLLKLFRSICINSAKNHHEHPEYGKLITWIDTQLVDIEVAENTDITDAISKKLKNVKKPIEGFKI